MAARPILASALLCCAFVAQASPRTDPTTGRAVFTGATTPHPTSILLNPAALGLGFNNELYFALTSALDLYDVDLASAGAVTGAELGAGGSLALILRPGTRYTVSFDMRMPPPELFPQDHEELRYFTLGQGQRDFLASIASTFRVTNRLYFGATLTHHNTFLRLQYARDTAAAAGEDVVGTPDADERYDVRVNTPYVSTGNLKVTLGVLLRLYNEVWLGVSYHTPPGFDIQAELEGGVEIERAPRDGGGRLVGDSVVEVSYPASVDAELSARLPQFLELHVGGRWEDLSRMQAYDVRVAGSQIYLLGIPEWQLRTRGLEDSFALWGGVDQVDTGQPFRFGGRVGFETSAVPPSRMTPLTMSPTSLTLDLGAQIRLGPWIAQLSYGLQYFPSVSVDESAFDAQHNRDCIASDFDYTTRGCEAVRNGYAIANGDGTYARMLHSLRLGFRYELP
ncbi:MAG TPA: hypothetical protein VK427_08640 [Kofleriaceae bacterium]|nr:hypothetical protein [Kofleriaceae bacterium]